MEPFTILVALVAGLLGALVMNRVLYWIGKIFGRKVDMVYALGAFLVKDNEKAKQTGTLVHIASGLLFGLIYGITFILLEQTELPNVLLIGIGMGFIHGLLAGYAFMILFTERHRDEEFRRTNIPVGVFYLIGHIIYGLIVGLCVGLLG